MFYEQRLGRREGSELSKHWLFLFFSLCLEIHGQTALDHCCSLLMRRWKLGLKLSSPLILPLDQLWSPALPPLEKHSIHMLFCCYSPRGRMVNGDQKSRWCCWRAPACSKELSAVPERSDNLPLIYGNWALQMWLVRMRNWTYNLILLFNILITTCS